MRLFSKKNIIGIVLLIFVVIGVLFLVQRSKNDIDGYLDLGAKYLEAQEYDKAITAYTDALEIDDMNVDAYLGLADAYVGAGEKDKAIEILKEGYEKTGNERIGRKLDILGQMGEITILPMSQNVFELATLIANMDVWTINGKPYTSNDFSKMTPKSAALELGLIPIEYNPNDFLFQSGLYEANSPDNCIYVSEFGDDKFMMMDNNHFVDENGYFLSYYLQFNSSQANIDYYIGERFPFDSNSNILFDYLENNGLTSFENIISYISENELDIDSTPTSIELDLDFKTIYISPSSDEYAHIEVIPITGEPTDGNPSVSIYDAPQCDLQFHIYHGL